jgi:hypothetical protein
VPFTAVVSLFATTMLYGLHDGRELARDSRTQAALVHDRDPLPRMAAVVVIGREHRYRDLPCNVMRRAM